MKFLVLFFSSFMALQLKAEINSRYPYGNFAFTGYHLGVYNSNSGIIPLAASANVDDFFNLGQLEILNESMEILIKQALNPNVIDCAYKNSDREFPESRTKFRSQLYEIFTWRHRKDLLYPGNFYISLYQDSGDSVGKAYVNLFYDPTNPLPGYSTKRYIHVAINTTYIGKENSYFQSINPNYWAGVIAHEMLHNLGYRHDQGYNGSFINEYGNCLWKEASHSKHRLQFKELIIDKN